MEVLFLNTLILRPPGEGWPALWLSSIFFSPTFFVPLCRLRCRLALSPDRNFPCARSLPGLDFFSPRRSFFLSYVRGPFSRTSGFANTPVRPTLGFVAPLDSFIISLPFPAMDGNLFLTPSRGWFFFFLSTPKGTQKFYLLHLFPTLIPPPNWSIDKMDL